MKILSMTSLAALGFAAAISSSSATPLAAGSLGVTEAQPEALIQKTWHSGLPHRRIVGDRVYGGRCPPQGCPAWSQRDLAQDPRTGEWYSPYNERQRAVNPYYGQEEYYGRRRRY